MKYLLSLFTVLATISSSCYSQTVEADFDIILDYQCGYTTVNLENKSINADYCFWDFYDNGQYVYFSNPNLRYGNIDNAGADGTFKFSMIAKGIGQSDTITKSIDFKPTHVKFDSSLKDSVNYAPLTVNFTNQSKPRNGDILTYEWEVNFQSVSSEENLTYDFTKPGTYFITLNAKTQNDCNLHYFESIVLKDSAQINEFDFITGGCTSSKTAACDHEKHLSIVNDTLKLVGSYSGNCCTKKTATMTSSGDTLYIRTFETGDLCTCDCDFCFSINVPNITADSVIVSFDGQLSTARLLTSVKAIENEPCFEIYPNPADHEFTLLCDQLTDQSSLEIRDLSGKIVFQLSNGLADRMIIQCNTIPPGTYVLKINLNQNTYRSRKLIIQ